LLEKEVASMRRIIRVLAVAALMAVLMVSSVSPAFAGGSDHNKDGTPGYSQWWQDDKTGTDKETDSCDRNGSKGYKSGTDC
jgi:hypothetical protein